jgi:hypothetical protein
MDDNPYSTPQFPHNWMRTPSSGQASFKMRIQSKDLLLVYKDSGSSQFGKAEIWVSPARIWRKRGNSVEIASSHNLIAAGRHENPQLASRNVAICLRPPGSGGNAGPRWKIAAWFSQFIRTHLLHLTQVWSQQCCFPLQRRLV